MGMARGIIVLYNPRLASHPKEILAQTKRIVQKDRRRVSWITIEHGYAFGYLHDLQDKVPIEHSEHDADIVCMVWGELYNQSTLEQQLGLDPVHPSALIKASYTQWKQHFLERLEGKFVLALFDKKERTLMIARDKMGLLPLYYSVTPHRLTIASEIKYILNFMDSPGEVDLNAVHEYFTFRFVGGENTLFKGIRECLPGHLYKMNGTGTVSKSSYWEPRVSDTPFSPSFQEASDAIEDSLRRAVAQRVHADSRTGALVSGGLDSSYGAVVLSQVVQKPFHTFFISFSGYDYNYSHYASYVSTLIRSTHHEYMINSEEYTRLLPHTIWINDEPLNHPSSVALCHLNQDAPQWVDDLFAGEGVDSIFGGAKAIILLPLVLANRHIPPPVKKILTLLPLQYIPSSKRHIAQKIIDSMVMSPDAFCILGEAFVPTDTVKSFLDPPPPETLFHHYYQLFEGYSKHNLIEKLFYFYQRPFLTEALNMEAKMGAAYGINYKYPFLATELIELANRMPLSYKKKRTQGKYLIKKTAEKYFSRQFIYKRKEGFGVPLEKWFVQDATMGSYVDMLLEPKTLQRGFYRKEPLKKLAQSARQGSLSPGEYECLLWTAVNFELWNRIFIDGEVMSHA